MRPGPWRAGLLFAIGALAIACGRKEAVAPPPAASPGAPAPDAAGQAITSPTDIDWVLVRLDDKTVLPNSGKLMQLRLVAMDKEAQGQSACNTFRSRFELDEAGLRFGPLAVTRMACPKLEVEKRYLEAIAQTSRWSIEGDRLFLADASGKKIAEFAQKSGSD